MTRRAAGRAAQRRFAGGGGLEYAASGLRSLVIVRRLARGAAGAVGQGFRAVDFVAEARGFLEIQIGGGLAHPRFQVVQDGLEIVSDADDVVGHAAVADLHQHMVALVDAVHDVADGFLDALRRDAVEGVVFDLLLAAAVGLGDGALHRAGNLVGIEDHLAVDIARGAADGLDQRRFTAQKTFLVGVEDRDQRAFGNVEAFAQQIDADQRVERAEAKVSDDLDALDGVDVRVHVAHANALLMQVFGEVFSHPFGQHRDQRAVTRLRGGADFADEIVHLRTRRTNVDRRIDESGRANDLLDEHAAAFVQLPAARRRRHRDALRAHHIPFLEPQRTVVHAGGQAETVFGERRLAAEVAL